MKLMVIPVGNSLVFSGSQAKNISYSTDHRWKIFRTLPITGKTYFGFFRITGKNYFVLYRAQAKTILYPTDHRQNLFWFFPDHRQKPFRTLPSTGKNYFVLYRSQAKPISYSRGITHYLSLSLSLSPLNVPKTGFPWSIPPDLARL